MAVMGDSDAGSITTTVKRDSGVFPHSTMLSLCRPPSIHELLPWRTREAETKELHRASLSRAGKDDSDTGFGDGSIFNSGGDWRDDGSGDEFDDNGKRVCLAD
ncbi:hypothetical protein S83_035731 [Arachis hypogaea]